MEKNVYGIKMTEEKNKRMFKFVDRLILSLEAIEYFGN